MGNDSSAWTALAANLPATIAALGALVVAIGTFVRAGTAAKLAVTAVSKADKAAAETTVIKANTDGRLSELQHKLDLARQEIDYLKTAAGVSAVQAALATPTPQQFATGHNRDEMDAAHEGG